MAWKASCLPIAHTIESAHLNNARFLIDDFGLFLIFKGRDLSSRRPLLGAYQRIYAIFEPLRSPAGLHTTKLGVTEIIEILKAIVHPERRPLLMSPSTSMVQ